MKFPVTKPGPSGSTVVCSIVLKANRTVYEDGVNVMDGGDRSQHIGWICKDIGHSLLDCSVPNRGSYCLGFGWKGVLKHSCPKCRQCMEKHPPNEWTSATFRKLTAEKQHKSTVIVEPDLVDHSTWAHNPNLSLRPICLCRIAETYGRSNPLNLSVCSFYSKLDLDETTDPYRKRKQQCAISNHWTW